MVFNKTQTHITEDELNSFPKFVREEFLTILDEVEFIKNMSSIDRPYAKDLPRDAQGRIIVDVTKPHILENTDYFRQAAIYYQKHGCYTKAFPTRNPNSEYMQFWKREIHRIYNGMVREEDGEWIPGEFYFYLNYSPIIKVIQKEKGKKRGQRVVDFPDFYDGDYLFFHYIHQAREAGSHADILKSRGKGYSFKGGSLLAKAFLFGDTEKAKEKIRAYALANEKEYLIKDGILNKFQDIINFLAERTPFPRLRIKDSLHDMHWRLGYIDKAQKIEKGLLNEVIGVSLMNDPQKARGKRGSYVLWEENGKFPNVVTAWQIARPSVEEDGIAFGLMITWGTGGTEGANFEGAQKFFYGPSAFNILPLPNVWDKGVNSSATQSAFFHPVYMNMRGCMDKDGNSDVIQAIIDELFRIQRLRDANADPNDIIQAKAERPIYPQDALMRKEGSLFPVGDLKAYLADISPNLQSFVAGHFVGDLVVTKKGVELDSTVEKEPIRDFPLKDNLNKHGAVEIFEKPYTDAKDIPFGRYIAGMDPFDDDSSTTNSLGSIFVMDSVTERIVAEYTGRPRTANEFYEICRRLLMYYNAICNYENDKKGFFAYMDRRNSLHYLADNPEILKSMQMMKPNYYGNKKKGTNSGKKINSFARRLLADWLLDKAYVVEGTNEEETVLNLHTIRSIGLLNELIKWTPDINADRVSAMGMLMILKADREKISERIMEEGKEVELNSQFFNNLLKKNIHNKPRNSFFSQL